MRNMAMMTRFGMHWMEPLPVSSMMNARETSVQPEIPLASAQCTGAKMLMEQPGLPVR